MFRQPSRRRFLRTAATAGAAVGLVFRRFTRRIRAEPATSAIPVIALTAHAMAGERERALQAGCNEYDTKPVEFPRLLGKIETLLEVSAA